MIHIIIDLTIAKESKLSVRHISVNFDMMNEFPDRR